MTFEKHTPGPWTYAPGFGEEGFDITLGRMSEWVGSEEKVFSYAMCLYPEDGAQHAEAEANARLIAAAPDLYAALKAAESALAIAASYRDDHKTLMQVTLDNARDVLAKARGTP